MSSVSFNNSLKEISKAKNLEKRMAVDNLNGSERFTNE